jgi:hypothetical protein
MISFDEIVEAYLKQVIRANDAVRTAEKFKKLYEATLDNKENQHGKLV